MDSAFRWLKASYIVGAVADGLVGVLMLLPGRMGEPGFRYAMGLGASLMFGWTVLLLWGYRKPMERRGILLITVFPVISGLVATGLWAAITGFLPVWRIIPTSIVGLALIALMGFSYWKAERARQAECPPTLR
ncbi:MAG: hypothetical protein HKO70_00665 [Acidimicrobiia bacterium]|nr:hypothetical protein [Acidimicrobiia bacterium]